MSKQLIVKNVPYGGVRAVIPGSQSTTQTTWYSEGRGDRYYVNSVNATASPVLESSTFQSYLSFTMSGAVQQQFNLIPMTTGESVIVETTIYAQNKTSSKAYAERVFGAWRHTGSSIAQVGGTISTTRLSDFTSVTTSWGVVGTSSVRLTCHGQSAEEIDWDIHINWKKGTHLILKTSQQISPLYPSA